MGDEWGVHRAEDIVLCVYSCLVTCRYTGPLSPYTHIRVAQPPSGSSNRDPDPGTGDGRSTSSTSSAAAFVTRADHTSSSWMAALRARRHHGRRLRPRRARSGLGGCCEGVVAGAVLAKTLDGGDAGGVQTRERHGPIVYSLCVFPTPYSLCIVMDARI